MAKNNKNVFPIPLEINWHEGMLLSQHHFQQNDLRSFRVLTSQLKLLSSNHFGVRHLRTDTVALSNGVYRVYEIEAVLPDGLIFSFFPEKHKGLKPLEINVMSFMKDDVNEITVYLTIAESSDDASPLLGNPPRYYSVEGDIVEDDNIKENTVKIPRLFPNCFLSIGDLLPELCVGFPLCKIIRIDGVYHVKNWTPPCFFIERHFPLWKRCEILTKSIREKVVYLSEKLKNSSTGSISSDTQSMLCKIAPVLPGLEALVYSNEIRPYELYQELAVVLGAVSVLIPTDIIPVMKSYNHNDIDDCLYGVIKLIEHYISTIERGFTVIQFNKKDIFFYYYLSSDNIDLLENNKLYIGIRSNKSTEMSNAENWMNNAVIVSDFAIDSVRTKRIKGANRSVLNQDIVSRILPGIGTILFEIDVDDKFIKEEQNLHIFNPSSIDRQYRFQPLDVILYLPRKV